MKIMQCWDDGVTDDVRVAEILRKYKAKATFNINPGLHEKAVRKDSWRCKDGHLVQKLALDEMKGVYDGFVIAGHTMTHPDLTKIPLEKARAELADCKKFIRDFFGQDACGFAYPGGLYNATVKTLVREAGYLYARTVANVDGALPLGDPMELPSHCHFMSPEFWSKYEAVRAMDGIFYFWGHAYEMMDSEALWGELEAKMDRIAADPQVEWIHVRDVFLS